MTKHFWSYRASPETVKSSSFLLSLLSPVWGAKITRLERTGPTMTLDLGAEESPAVFAKLVDAAMGAEVELPGGMQELLAMGLMADRCLMPDVRSAVEREGLARLDVRCCAQVLKSTRGTEMRALADAARALALHSFCALGGRESKREGKR